MTYEDAIEEVKESLKGRESYRVLSKEEKQKAKFNADFEIWKIDTEVLKTPNELRAIKFHIVFTKDFPHTFPKVLVPEDEYQKYGYLPHILEKLVCTHDNHARPNPETPGRVVEELIKRSRKIVEDGINGLNKDDFEEEFKAYWENPYSENDKLLENVLIVVEQDISEDFKVICLDKPINSIGFIVHQEEPPAVNLKSYLDDQKLGYKEVGGYSLGNIDSIKEPPFYLRNRDVANIVSGLDSDRIEGFKKYIDSSTYPKLILFKKSREGEIQYYGWFHKYLKRKRNGYRDGSLNNYKVLTTFQGTDFVTRITTEILSDKRLSTRSSGFAMSQDKKTFAVVGVGSIGSNLVHFINTYNPEFRLIDPDKLKVENIGRHLLGFSHLHSNKTLALKEYLVHLLPTQKTSTKEERIYDVVTNTPEYLNDSDYIFAAMGDVNMEHWMADRIKDGTITKPTFFLWVEPYLLGGHCVYIHPNDPRYQDYFDEQRIFKFSIIDPTEFGNPILSSKEAGCQTNFTPYSSGDVQKFLGSLFPRIAEIIDNNQLDSTSFTWVGDTRIATDLKISLSGFAKNLTAGELIENKQ